MTAKHPTNAGTVHDEGPPISRKTCGWQSRRLVLLAVLAEDRRNQQKSGSDKTPVIVNDPDLKASEPTQSAGEQRPVPTISIYQDADHVAGILQPVHKSTQNVQYSWACYLYLDRNALLDSGQLRTVDSLTDAEGLKSGDFVEYQASFRPNEINAMLDILTPDR